LIVVDERPSSMKISSKELSKYDRFYRANLINSLTGFKSVSLIGSISHSKQTNLAIFSNIVHLGADPALVGFINRPLAAAPHTIANIQSTGFFTINHIHSGLIDAAHHTSAKYPKEVSEFDAAELTPEYSETFPAPYVKESRIKYGCTFKEIIPIRMNDTFLVIGEITEIHLNEKIISTDGFLRIEEADSLCSLGIDGYYKTEFIKRLPHAKCNS
jgi:flavin reductase (DIM6/NTAB) family NADH-FMN oxidoreductase RutF